MWRVICVYCKQTNSDLRRSQLLLERSGVSGLLSTSVQIFCVPWETKWSKFELLPDNLDWVFFNSLSVSVLLFPHIIISLYQSQSGPISMADTVLRCDEPSSYACAIFTLQNTINAKPNIRSQYLRDIFSNPCSVLLTIWDTNIHLQILIFASCSIILIWGPLPTVAIESMSKNKQHCTSNRLLKVKVKDQCALDGWVTEGSRWITELRADGIEWLMKNAQMYCHALTLKCPSFQSFPYASVRSCTNRFPEEHMRTFENLTCPGKDPPECVLWNRW